MLIREYQKGDERQIVELFNFVFDRSRTLMDWYHIFTNNPAGISYISVAIEDNKIIASASLIPFLLSLNQKCITAYQWVDVMIHPRHRNTFALLSNLIIHLDKSFKMEVDLHNVLCFGFPNKNIQKIASKLTKPTLSGYIPRYILQLQRKTSCPSRKDSIIYRIFDQTAFIFKILFSKIYSQRKHSFEILQLACFDSTIDSIWEQAKSDIGVSIIRNHQYLNWKYEQLFRPSNSSLSVQDAHMSPYQAFLAKMNHTPVGYCILKCDQKEGIVVDFLCKNDKYIIKYLLNHIIQFFTERNMERVIFYVSNKNIRRYLLLSGFVRSPTSSYQLSIRTYHPDNPLNTLTNYNNWHLTYSDISEF